MSVFDLYAQSSLGYSGDWIVFNLYAQSSLGHSGDWILKMHAKRFQGLVHQDVPVVHGTVMALMYPRSQEADLLVLVEIC